jgi:nucleolar protein 4
VRQAKIVLEKTGRSRGYGFIEYDSHASALKGLRWLNARVVGERKVETDGDRKRRLLVEFAIENAQVVKRRQEREAAARRKAIALKEADAAKAAEEKTYEIEESSGKRKRGDKDSANKKRKGENDTGQEVKVDENVGKIIGAKRFRRKLERGKKGK